MSHCCWRVSGRRCRSCCIIWRVSVANVEMGATSLMLPRSDRQTTNFFTGAPLASLTTLSFSDNVDLQRSAALAFAEITEKEVREVGRDTLDPILFLLGSHDTEVQRAASAALGNLAVNRESPATASTT